MQVGEGRCGLKTIKILKNMLICSLKSLKSLKTVLCKMLVHRTQPRPAAGAAKSWTVVGVLGSYDPHSTIPEVVL